MRIKMSAERTREGFSALKTRLLSYKTAAYKSDEPKIEKAPNEKNWESYSSTAYQTGYPLLNAT